MSPLHDTSPVTQQPHHLTHFLFFTLSIHIFSLPPFLSLCCFFGFFLKLVPPRWQPQPRSLTQTGSCSGWRFPLRRRPRCWKCLWLPQAEGRSGQLQAGMREPLSVRKRTTQRVNGGLKSQDCRYNSMKSSKQLQMENKTAAVLLRLLLY